MGLLNCCWKYNTDANNCVSAVRRRSTIYFRCTIRMRIKYTGYHVRGTRISFAHQSIHWCRSIKSQREENPSNSLHTMACRALDTNLIVFKQTDHFFSIAVIKNYYLNYYSLKWMTANMNWWDFYNYIVFGVPLIFFL